MSNSGEGDKKAFAEEIDQHFGKWPTLARKVQLAVDSFITQVTNMTTPKVLESCNIETSFPITWDSQRSDEVVAKIHFYLEQALNPLSTEQNTAPKFRSIYSLFDFGDSILNLNNKRPQVPGSLHENVIKIMEMAQAYYSIARSRFGDNIPMIIHHNLVHQLSDDTESYLFEALGFTNAAFTDDDCLKLLEEKPHVLAKRKELNARISHLEEIHSKVFSESISANF
ncbi:hypothetical protein L0F63_003927 [Massospora cicadina]|nr:hypothetical protein L0F63_003927 [Massospora cicadina]